jgi:hypothetical protein
MDQAMQTLQGRLVLAFAAAACAGMMVACCSFVPGPGAGPKPAEQTSMGERHPEPVTVALLDPGPPPPDEGPVPSLANPGAKGAAAYDLYPEPWRSRFVKDWQDKLEAARKDVAAATKKWKAEMEAAEKELKAEKAHIERLKELGVTVDRTKQLNAATGRVAELKQLGEEGAAQPSKLRLKVVEANDPPYFASQKDRQEAEFAALPAAEQERRKDLRRQKQEWLVKKQEADEHNRNAEEARKRGEAEAEKKRREQDEARRRAEAEKKRREKPVTGEVGYIEVDNASVVYVPVDDKAHDELVAFASAGNDAAIKQMVARGRLMVCPNGTKVSVVRLGFFASTIRIMEGKHAGRDGIIDNEWLHK